MPSGTPSSQDHLAAIWQRRGATSPHERARTLGLFYALGSLVALGSIAVGAWPATDRLRIAVLGIMAAAAGAGLWAGGDRLPRRALSLSLSVGILMIATAQLAAGSPSAAVSYGMFNIFAVIYTVLFASAIEMVMQMSLIVLVQTYVIQQVGSFAAGDARGLAAQIFMVIAAGAGVGIAMSYHVHRRQQAEHRAMAQSQLDTLTGLANRPTLVYQIERAIRTPATSAALLLIDLNGFREINDTFGVEVGDQLLTAVAQRLADAIRAEDVVARIGADEFAILRTVESRVAIPQVAERAAERLHQTLREPFELEGITLSIETRIGIAVAAERTSAEELLRQADLAVDRARDDARSMAVVTDIPPRRSPDRLQLLADVRSALYDGDRGDGGVLVPYFQPKVALASGQLEGAEALVRWQHPTRGLVPPNDFLPLLERTNLMRDLTAHMLAESLQACMSWHRHGMALSVSVNVSARDLNDRGLVQVITAALARTGLSASTLTVEITETALMNDLAQASAVVHELRALGVGVSVDDFGTGWSSLAHLQRLPLSELKVDRSFVSAARTDAGAAKIVAATIGLGQSLGLAAVAEGVEDAETLGWLADLGCDFAQGWHLGRPMPAADFTMFARAAVTAGKQADRESGDRVRATNVASSRRS
jgi:diguanylate cyclase (GGDEF)-like protein